MASGQFESRVAGIPCIIDVAHYLVVRGSHSYNAPSDYDYYGYTESDWSVCDQRGRPAAWLERKLTNDDHDRIEAEIDDYFARNDY